MILKEGRPLRSAAVRIQDFLRPGSPGLDWYTDAEPAICPQVERGDMSRTREGIGQEWHSRQPMPHPGTWPMRR